jgi:hypothetical protein
VKWLVVSLVLSVALTVLLNVAIRVWPGAANRGAEGITAWAKGRGAAADPGEPGRVRVIIPWKAMVIASIAATVLLNLVVRLV